jgi:GntR family transcriptional repressor for pyruvate dehydrogenase complex
MPDLTLARIDRGNLVDDIVQRLEAEILRGALRPGDQLPTERDLCAQLGVSRTSLRAAMQRLAERGLLSVEVGRGTFVLPPNARRLSERLALLLRLDESSYWKITEARHVVEPRIAALAARRRQAADLEAMRAALRRMDVAMNNGPAFVEPDELFHLALAQAAGNEVLAMLSQTLQSMMQQMRTQIFTVLKVSAQAQRYHWQIFDAVERGIPEEAQAAMEEHLNEMEGYVRSSLAAGPGETPANSDGRQLETSG